MIHGRTITASANNDGRHDLKRNNSPFISSAKLCLCRCHKQQDKPHRARRRCLAARRGGPCILARRPAIFKTAARIRESRRSATLDTRTATGLIQLVTVKTLMLRRRCNLPATRAQRVTRASTVAEAEPGKTRGNAVLTLRSELD